MLRSEVRNMASTLGAAQMLAELKVGSNLDKVSSTQYPALLITDSPWHHGRDAGHIAAGDHRD